MTFAVFSVSRVSVICPVFFSTVRWRRCVSAADYLLVVLLASLLFSVLLLWGVGILEGFPLDWRGVDRGLPESVTVSDTSEHTDWMSEMSKSEASLPLRLLPRLPALLPGRLEILLRPVAWPLALRTAVFIRVPSSPDWKPFPDI